MSLRIHPRCLLVAVLLVLVAPATSARALALPTVDLSSDPWFVGWTEALPPAYLGVNTDSSDICVAGKVACVDKVARILGRQVSDLGCDHNAVFSVAYLRTTQEVEQTVSAAQPFFDDTPWLDHYTATFAQLYLRAWNAWRTGGTPPEAWRIAFQSADDQAVSGAGNLLLGMSAHVNRDLPFALYSIGLVAPNGMSRKHDHDLVNVLLNAVLRPLLDELAARYDPSVRSIPGQPSLADFLEFQVLPEWREEAWRNAVALTTAPDAAARGAVAEVPRSGPRNSTFPSLNQTLGRSRTACGTAGCALR
jgi:hypothetical protein